MAIRGATLASPGGKMTTARMKGAPENMKKAKVNGVEISGEAVSFELDRLVRFYMSHGMTIDEIKNSLCVSRVLSASRVKSRRHRSKTFD